MCSIQPEEFQSSTLHRATALSLGAHYTPITLSTAAGHFKIEFVGRNPCSVNIRVAYVKNNKNIFLSHGVTFCLNCEESSSSCAFVFHKPLMLNKPLQKLQIFNYGKIVEVGCLLPLPGHF